MKSLFTFFAAALLTGCIITRDPVQVKEIRVTCLMQWEYSRVGHGEKFATLWEDTDGNKYETRGDQFYLPGMSKTIFVSR
jgi:hypothetical protein